MMLIDLKKVCVPREALYTVLAKCGELPKMLDTFHKGMQAGKYCY